jgi:hypothetical protein
MRIVSEAEAEEGGDEGEEGKLHFAFFFGWVVGSSVGRRLLMVSCRRCG